MIAKTLRTAKEILEVMAQATFVPIVVGILFWWGWTVIVGH